MIGGGLFVLIVKQLTASNRPSSIFAIEQSFSFPSGHTALAAIFAIVTGYYTIRDKRKGHKKPILAFVILYVLLIALSRLMLGEHWFIDILGGVLIALSWSTAVIFYFKSKSRK
jgi:undecaprenyl-diphosphatase